MSGTARSLRAFLDVSPRVALVEVAEAKGSTPRDKGAWMLVSPEKIFGTIGGGQLEFMAIDRARAMLGEVFSPLEGEMSPKATEGVGSGSAGHEETSSATETTPPRSATRIDPPLKGEGKALTPAAPARPGHLPAVAASARLPAPPRQCLWRSRARP